MQGQPLRAQGLDGGGRSKSHKPHLNLVPLAWKSCLSPELVFSGQCWLYLDATRDLSTELIKGRAYFLLSHVASLSMSWSRVYFQHYLQVEIHPLGRSSPLEPSSLSTNIHQSHRSRLAFGVVQDVLMTQRRLPVPFGQGCCWLDEEIEPCNVGT